jgi:hypothetical protein
LYENAKNIFISANGENSICTSSLNPKPSSVGKKQFSTQSFLSLYSVTLKGYFTRKILIPEPIKVNHAVLYVCALVIRIFSFLVFEKIEYKASAYGHKLFIQFKYIFRRLTTLISLTYLQIAAHNAYMGDFLLSF